MCTRFLASAGVARSFAALALFLVLGATIGCTKSAESLTNDSIVNVAARKKSVPSLLGRLPLGPRVVVYAPSLANVVEDWTTRVTDSSPGPEATRQVTRLLRETPFAHAVAAARGELVVGVYGLEDEDPTWVGFVAGDTAPQLDSLLRTGLDSLAGNDVTVAGQVLSSNTWDGEPVVHGIVPGGWVVGSKDAVEYLLTNSSTPVASELVDAWAAVANTPPRLFASVSVGDVFKKPADKEQAVMLGVDGVDRVSFALFENSDRQQDTVFVHTKAPHRSVVSLLAGKPIQKSAISSLPATTTVYSAISLDLLGFWSGLRAGLPDRFKSQLDMAEQGLKLDVGKDLLAHIGHQISFTQFTAVPGQKPVVLSSLALANRSAFKATVDRVKQMSPVPVNFQPGANGADFLVVPGPAAAAPGVAITDDALLFCDSRAALDGIISGAVETGGVSDITKLFDRYGGRATMVSWMSQAALRGTSDYKELLDTAMSQQPASVVSAAWGSFAWTALSPALGDLAVVVVPDDQGLRLIVETDCGMTPVLAMAAALSIEDKQDRMARKSIDKLAANIRAAQQRYHEQFGRFATSLWELRRVKLLGSEIASGINGRLLYRVVASETEWHLEARHEAAALRYSVRSDGFVESVQ